LRAQAAEDMKKLLDAHARTAEEREALQSRLETEAAARRKMEKGKHNLQAKLKAMEEKLIQVHAVYIHTTNYIRQYVSSLWCVDACSDH
jgi:uncharacterized protein (DUF3084 family)